MQEGAKLIVHGLTEAEVTACEEDLSSLGDVVGFAADLAKADEATALANFAQAQGDVDILVNNVGIFSVKPFEELTDEDWLHYFNINVLSAVRMSRIFLPAMLKRGEGSIINMASEAAVKPLPQMVHYSVTKTAMLGLTRGMAELTKGTGVRVNSILPGPTWTEGSRLISTVSRSRRASSSAQSWTTTSSPMNPPLSFNVSSNQTKSPA